MSGPCWDSSSVAARLVVSPGWAPGSDWIGTGVGSRLELGFCLGAGVLTDDEVAIREVTTGAESTVHALQSLEVSDEYTVADIQFHHAS
jgi:hypothetical protein